MNSDRHTVLIILSKDIAPYRSVNKGVLRSLQTSKQTISIKELVLPETDIPKSIIKANPDLIIAIGSSALRKVATNKRNIPIIYAAVLDPPLESKANITGASLRIPVHMQFERLKTVLPTASNIGVIYNRSQNSKQIEGAREIAAQNGLTLQTFPIQTPEEIPRVENLDIDVLWMIPDSMLKSSAVVKHLLISTFKAGIPVMGVSSSYVKAGALFALSCDYEENGRQAGEITLRVLSGEHAGDITPANPTSSNLYINLAVARKLRIPISKTTLAQAHRVFGQ